MMGEFGSEESKAEIIGRDLPGFSLVDFAFHAAAGMYEFLPGEHVSLDTGFYSWSSLGSAKKPEEIPRGEGPPEEAARILKKAAKFFGAAELQTLGEHSRHMGVALETTALDERKNSFHLALVVDVFGEHVLVEWVAR